MVHARHRNVTDIGEGRLLESRRDCGKVRWRTAADATDAVPWVGDVVHDAQ